MVNKEELTQALPSQKNDLIKEFEKQLDKRLNTIIQDVRSAKKIADSALALAKKNELELGMLQAKITELENKNSALPNLEEELTDELSIQTNQMKKIRQN